MKWRLLKATAIAALAFAMVALAWKMSPWANAQRSVQGASQPFHSGGNVPISEPQPPIVGQFNRNRQATSDVQVPNQLPPQQFRAAPTKVQPGYVSPPTSRPFEDSLTQQIREGMSELDQKINEYESQWNSRPSSIVLYEDPIPGLIEELTQEVERFKPDTPPGLEQ